MTVVAARAQPAEARAAIMVSRPPFAIAHAPGRMRLLDVPDAASAA